MVTWGGVTTDSSDLVKLSNGRDKGLRGGDVGGGVTTDSSDLVKLSNDRDKGLRGGDVGGDYR